ncbi:MAG: type II toxin-antitoxin system RelB/DinJ family antitoxin [Eubacterium sp.]|nr:type II toxin-antitoxin system RelB/DinJ family antitoxin [Eubacterium sp.]
MAAKSSLKSTNVTARMDPDLKAQAENILDKIGLNSSVVITALYKQIVYHRGLPFALTVPESVEYDRSMMTAMQYDSMLEKGYAEALAGKGRPADEVYHDLLNDLKGQADV